MIMGFFDKLKKKKKIGNWEDAYIAAPNFYEKPDGTPFGAIALTEGTETVLPKSPQNRYRVDGKAVSEWIILLSVLIVFCTELILEEIRSLKEDTKEDTKEQSKKHRQLTVCER